MNQTSQQTTVTEKRVVTAADIPLTLKARYVGTGFVLGVFASPLVRQTLGRVTPRVSELLDKLTGQAESLAESGSDLLAQAKELLRRDEGKKAQAAAPARKKKKAAKHDHDGHAHDHAGHDHDHAHDHVHAADAEKKLPN